MERDTELTLEYARRVRAKMLKQLGEGEAAGRSSSGAAPTGRGRTWQFAGWRLRLERVRPEDPR